MKKLFNNVINNIETKTTKYIETAITKTAIEYLKTSFGTEIDMVIFPANPEYDIFVKFVKKYDSNFKKHSTYNDFLKMYCIVDKEFVLKLQKDTFVYICTGSKYWKDNTDVEKLFSSQNGSLNDHVYMYFFGKKSYMYKEKLMRLFNKANISSRVKYHFKITGNVSQNGKSSGMESFTSIFSELKPRNFDTLFFDEPVVKSITDHLETYNNQKVLFDKKDIIFKTGILLQGQPGTGKTSTASAIATYMGCSLISVDINTLKYIDIAALSDIINNDDNRYVILLEDIDCVVLNRESDNVDKEDKSIINKLLQFLDSSVSPTDVIFVATTNHPELLDEALIRAGRFNLVVNVDGITTPRIIEMCRSFTLNSDNSLEDNVLSKLRDMGKNPDVDKISQSLVQKLIFESYGNLSINATSEEESE